MVIITDEIYSVPNRSVHTNTHLITDSIDYVNQMYVPLVVVSLDQASAYDYVEHPYKFHVLRKFGFGMTLMRNIRTVQGMVKINGTLTTSFKYTRGVRQGDLYTLRSTVHTHH